MTICERMFAIIDSSESKSAAGLSKALGVGTSQTTNWKQRNSDPPAKMIYKICEYLEVSVEYLLTGKETNIQTGLNITDKCLLQSIYSNKGDTVFSSNEIAERIKTIMKRKNIQSKQMFCDLDMGINTLNNFKTSMPKTDTLAKIAEYLDCSVDFLIGRTEFDTCVHTPVQAVCENRMNDFEIELLGYFRQCNSKGKRELLNIAERLAASAAEQGMA